MMRSLILRTGAALASAAMVLAFAASPVHAATITLNDSNCDSFALSGTAPNQSLSCIVSNAPSGCAISPPGPSSGTINTAFTLTATCATGSPNTWRWTGGNCDGQTTQSCSANSAVVGQVTYRVTPSNNIGAGNQATTTIDWSNTPPQAPTGCLLSANPASLPVGGGSVSLTASCTGGGAPTGYTWTASPTPTSGFSANGGSQQPAVSIAATTFFSVTPSNAGGNGNQATVSVNVAGTVVGFCNQYPTVLPIVNATWGQQGGWSSPQSGNFSDNTVWLFKLDVPPGTPPSSVIGRFTVSEGSGPATFRQLTISTQACDFRQKDYTGINGPLAVSNGTTASVSYGVATPFIFGPAGLIANNTYYISVRNWQLDPTPQSSCGLNSCNALMVNIPAAP